MAGGAGKYQIKPSPSSIPPTRGEKVWGKLGPKRRGVIEVRTSFDKSGIISVSKFLIKGHLSL